MFRKGKWQVWRGVLAALALFAFTAGPAIDRMVCGDAAVAAADIHADGDHPADEADHDGACHHGHCHHGGGFVTTAVAGAGAPARADGLLRPPPDDRSLSDLQFSLMRPPRA